jgi:hypothetical protein
MPASDLCQFRMSFSFCPSSEKKAVGWYINSKDSQVHHHNCLGSTTVKGVVLANILHGVPTKDSRISQEHLADALNLRSVSGANASTARRVLKAKAKEDNKIILSGFLKTSGFIKSFTELNPGSSAILKSRDSGTGEVRLI